MWAGVAGGLAEYFEVDPVLIRLIWVATTVFTGGLIILVYIVLWVIMPRDDQLDRYAAHWRGWSDELHADAQRVADEARRVASGFGGHPGEPVASAAPPPPPPPPPTAPPPPPPSAWADEPYAGPGWMPEHEHYHHHLNRRQKLGGFILVGLGLIFLASNAGLLRWANWNVFWPLILVGLGVALLVRYVDRSG
jgi:phage shock protein C